MDSTTSLLFGNTGSTAATTSTSVPNWRNNGSDAGAFSSQFQEQYQQQENSVPRQTTSVDNRNQDQWNPHAGNTTTTASQPESSDLQQLNEHVTYNRNRAEAETETGAVREATEKTEKVEQKTDDKAKNNAVDTSKPATYAEIAAEKQAASGKTAVKNGQSVTTEIIAGNKNNKSQVQADKDNAAVPTEKKAAKTETATTEKTSAATEKMTVANGKEVMVNAHAASNAAAATTPAAQSTKTATATPPETRTTQVTTAVASAIQSETKNVSSSTSAPISTTANRTKVMTAEESDVKTGKELENISGVKINRISNGNTLATQSGNNSSNNNTTDHSGTDSKNLLQSLADKSSHLQQKLQAQTTNSNAETVVHSARPATATSGSESAAGDKVKLSTTSLNDKNLLAGLDLLRRNDVGSAMKEAQINPTTASSLTEQINGIQQLAEKISEAVSSQNTMKGQGITMDFESESMGRMQMFLQQKGNSIQIVFEPGSESCRQQLQDQQQELAQELRKLGYDNLSLSIADNRTADNRKNSERNPEKNSASGNEDIDNVKLAGDAQADLAQLLAV